jgi:hypothetical protein
MKSQQGKRTFWKSVLSAAVLSFFILLSTGSYEILPEINDIIFYNEAAESFDASWQIGVILSRMACPRDEYGCPHGQATIERGVDKGNGEVEVRYSEESNMVNGKRDGVTKMWLGEVFFEVIMSMGHPLFYEPPFDPNQKSATEPDSGTSAFEIFTGEYPCSWYTLYAFGYDSTYMKAYMDTLETILNAEPFEELDFDDRYQNALAVLEETPYDSIISANTFFSLIEGLEELKRSELRMAVIDRYRSDASTTFGIVQSTYPGYLLKMHEGEVTDQDFEEFCRVLDSTMTSYGLLDVEDPYFTDSVDVRMFRALDEISSVEKSALSLKNALVKMNIRQARQALQSLFSTGPSIGEVADVVFYFMFLQFDEGDFIKNAVKKSWCIKHEIISPPIVTTELSANNLGSSVTMKGYIIEDGGAEVTSRGVAWAETYDPTTGDNREDSGTGTDPFTVQLDGLTEGTTYYARAFAANSAGTAYGNCVKFTATGASGIHVGGKSGMEMNIYPNPATALTNFIFHIPSAERMEMTLVNLNGQVVHRLDLGILPVGEQRFELDLSLLQDGTYHCHITAKGRIISSRKLVIAR